MMTGQIQLVMEPEARGDRRRWPVVLAEIAEHGGRSAMIISSQQQVDLQCRPEHENTKTLN